MFYNDCLLASLVPESSPGDVQDLQLALEKARSALQEREEQLRDGEQERQRQDEETERTVRELRTSLLTKEQLIEVRHTPTVFSQHLLPCFYMNLHQHPQASCRGHITGMHTADTLHAAHTRQKPPQLNV